MSDDLDAQRATTGEGADVGPRPAAPPRRRKSPVLTGCLVVVVAAGIVGLLLMLGIFLFVVGAGITQMPGVKGEGRFKFEEVTLSGSRGAPKIVCVPLEGVITTSASFGMGVDLVTRFAAELQQAERDEKVAGVLIAINSPGGGITGSDILHEEILRYRSKTQRPVVACMTDMGASGAYYAACACDRIVAHPTTMTGSIGVLLPLYDASRLLDFVGIKSEMIKSGPLKGMGSPFVEKSAEQKEKERQIFQSLIDSMYDRFVKIVAEGRGLEPDKVRQIADGRILTSQQALEMNLIDSVGYTEDAVELVKKMARIRNAHVIQYRRVVPFTEILGSVARGRGITLDLGGDLRALLRLRPMYLWLPPSGGE